MPDGPGPILRAIAQELARERTQGHDVACIRVSSHGLEGSVTSVPKVSGNLGQIAYASRLLAGNPLYEILLHPDDWERLMREVPLEGYGPDSDVRVDGVPIEHSA